MMSWMVLTMLETLGMESGGLSVKFGGEFLNGGEVVLLAAEQVHDFNRRTKICKWVNFQNFKRLDAFDASIGIFLKQSIEDSAGLLTIFREDVALANIFGAFAAGERRLVEGNVANQVKGIVVAAYLL